MRLLRVFAATCILEILKERNAANDPPVKAIRRQDAGASGYFFRNNFRASLKSFGNGAEKRTVFSVRG